MVKKKGEKKGAKEGADPDREAEAIADVMFALSSPNRVRILIQLREAPHTVGELVSAMEMEQSAVSHQLRVLREHRLVAADRRGRERLYSLYDAHVASLLDEAVRHVSELAGAGAKQPRRLRRSA
ncbi:MAG: helix-turn-helix transcriptional regulator [Actinobacteria bacterium]|nr:helix-turn-helix transcriptional regulator [Actinomycetota bacterium]MBS1882010.1 helix-turn-helix transcriptional regulator [Actinomycetota bacterium]